MFDPPSSIPSRRSPDLSCILPLRITVSLFESLFDSLTKNICKVSSCIQETEVAGLVRVALCLSISASQQHRVWTRKGLDSSPTLSLEDCELLMASPSLSCLRSVSAPDMQPWRGVDNIHCSGVMPGCKAGQAESQHGNSATQSELPSPSPHSLAMQTGMWSHPGPGRKITVSKNQRRLHLQEPYR